MMEKKLRVVASSMDRKKVAKIRDRLTYPAERIGYSKEIIEFIHTLDEVKSTEFKRQMIIAGLWCKFDSMADYYDEGVQYYD